jgi:hypothetical protein
MDITNGRINNKTKKNGNHKDCRYRAMNQYYALPLFNPTKTSKQEPNNHTAAAGTATALRDTESSSEHARAAFPCQLI